MNNWKALIRDIIILIALTFFGGMFIGGLEILGLQSRLVIIYQTLLNVIMMIIGFTIAGCLTKSDRLRHLSYVAVGVWIFSLVNTLLGMNLFIWVLVILPAFITMFIGYGISLLLVKQVKPKELSDNE